MLTKEQRAQLRRNAAFERDTASAGSPQNRDAVLILELLDAHEKALDILAEPEWDSETIERVNDALNGR